MKSKHITKLTSFLLIPILLFVSIVFPSFYKYAYAEVAEAQFEQYLTGNNISDSYIEEVDDTLTEKYRQYIYIDEGHIQMATTEIEEKYSEYIFNESIPAETYIEYEDEYFDIAAVRMIRRNMSIMNDLVDEELGQISEDFEFVFYETDEYVQQWRVWGCELRWNKIVAKFDSDCAILFSIIFLVGALAVEAGSLYTTISAIKNNDDLIATVVMEAFVYIPTDIAAQLVSFFSNEVLATLTTLGTTAIDLLTSSNIAWTVFEVIYGLLCPSLTDCIIILYYSISQNKGIDLKFCWLPTWREKWGFSIKTI